MKSMKKALRHVTAVQQQQSSTSIVSLSSDQAPASSTETIVVSSIEAPISLLAGPPAYQINLY